MSPNKDYLKSKTGSKGLLGGSGEYWNKVSEASEKRWCKSRLGGVRTIVGQATEQAPPRGNL